MTRQGSKPVVQAVQQGAVQLETGVCWCKLSLSSRVHGLLLLVREREHRAACSAAARDVLVRRVVTQGVSAAEELASDPSITTEELLARAYALRGEPLSQARARRDLRERVRVWRALSSGEPRAPETPRELIELWTYALRDEVPIYKESARPQFRVKGIPFSQDVRGFECVEVPPEKETVAASKIEGEVRHLLAFMRRTDVPIELRAAVAKFGIAYIHPFRDGNGHTGRLLACQLLAGAYAPETLLCFDAAMQQGRSAESVCIKRTVLARADLEEFACLFLEQLRQAQERAAGPAFIC